MLHTRPMLALALALAVSGCSQDGLRPGISSTRGTSSLLGGSGGSKVTQAAGRTLTIVTYNVNYGLAQCNDGGRCSADAETLSLLESIDADVLLLQETTPAWEAVLRPRLSQRFSHVTFHDPTTYAPGGNATFSKLPIETDVALPSPLGWFPANRLVVQSETGPIELVNVHLRPAISERGSWVEGYFSTGHFRKREMDTYAPSFSSSLPTIVAGDFNEDVGGDAMDALAALGFESGFADVGPSRHTWHYTAYGIPLALTLDHVAYEAEFFEAVSVEVLPGGRSDHQPVRLVLRMKA